MNHIHNHDMPMPDHGGHGGHDMPGMGGDCVVSMLWNTNVMNTCIVFSSWRITSGTLFTLSFFFIIGLGIFYEYLRIFSRQFDYNLARTLYNDKAKGRIRLPSHEPSPERRGDDITGSSCNAHLLRKNAIGTRVPLVPRLLRAGLYGSTVFLSFFLMLIFMTYNAYLILAVVLGAAIGHFIFGSTINADAILCDPSNGKGMACH